MLVLWGIEGGGGGINLSLGRYYEHSAGTLGFSSKHKSEESEKNTITTKEMVKLRADQMNNQYLCIE